MSYYGFATNEDEYLYLTNSHGDIIRVLNEGMATVAAYEYDEFGNLTYEWGDIENDVLYSGEFYDSESENYYLRARYYDPRLGRFTQADSFLGVADNPLSLNRYTYCHNNPIMFIDPSGHEARIYSGGGLTYGYDTNDFKTSRQDNESSIWMGKHQRGEIGNEEFLWRMNELGIHMSVIGGNLDWNASQKSDFISAEDLTISFEDNLSYEDSLTVAREFDRYYNSEWKVKEELLYEINQLSSVSVIKNETLLNYYYKQTCEKPPYYIIDGKPYYFETTQETSNYYMGARYLVEGFGGIVKWYENHKTAVFYLNNRQINARLVISDKNEISIDLTDADKKQVLNVGMRFENGNTFEINVDDFLEYFDIGGMYGYEYDVKESLSPAGYTYLMKNYYDYYLSDSADEKLNCLQAQMDFIENEFKSVDAKYSDAALWNERIKFMQEKPNTEITEDEHFFRNELNLQFSWGTFETLNERLPDNLKWKELPFEQSAFHKFGQVNNRKYVSACEHFEVVYTKENYLVDESFSAMNMGTYNYYGPAQTQKHTDIDVEPWVKWGNTPKGWIWSDWID